MKNSKKLAELTDLKPLENLDQVKGGFFLHLLFAKKSYSYGGHSHGHSGHSHGHSGHGHNKGYNKGC